MCVAFCSPPMLPAVFPCYTLLPLPLPSSFVLNSVHPLSPFSSAHHPLSHSFDLHPKCFLPFSRSRICRLVGSHTHPFSSSPKCRSHSRFSSQASPNAPVLHAVSSQPLHALHTALCQPLPVQHAFHLSFFHFVLNSVHLPNSLFISLVL